jgi:hypothetical protein
MLIYIQDDPTAALHTVELANDVSGLDVAAFSTHVNDVELHPGQNSEIVQEERPPGTPKGPNPLAVATRVGTFPPALSEGQSAAMALAGSVGRVHTEDSVPVLARVALRKARAELFAQMRGDQHPRGRYYPSLVWRDLPAKLPFAWEPQVLRLEARRAGGCLSRHTQSLRQEEFNGVILEHRMAEDEIFSRVLKLNALRFWQAEEDRRIAEERDAELRRCGCF